MKRKRVTTAPSHFDLRKLARWSGGVDDSGSGLVHGKCLIDTSDGCALFALDSELVTCLIEGYARQQRQTALEEIAAASQEKDVTYPAALSGPGGALIDMTTLVIHTGSRFLSRADLFSQSGGQRVRSLCPPNADEATKQRYADDATAALMRIMVGTPPRHLSLDAIASLLDQAQYFGAVFVVSILPQYLRPLASQLTPAEATNVLVRSLSAVQGDEATHAYKGMLQVLAPCITSAEVPVFTAAGLELVAAAKGACGSNGSREIRDMLIELAGGLAEFQPVHALPSHLRAGFEATGGPGGDATTSRSAAHEALLCIVVVAAACSICDGSCGSDAVAAADATGEASTDASTDVAATAGAAEPEAPDHGEDNDDGDACDENDSGDESASEGSQEDGPADRAGPADSDDESDGEEAESTDSESECEGLESPEETLQRCVARCCAVVGRHERLSLHATAALKMLIGVPQSCTCREAVVQAALDRRSPLQRLAAAPDGCNQHIVVAQGRGTTVLAAKLRWPGPEDDDVATRPHPLSLPCDWRVVVCEDMDPDPESEPIENAKVWDIGLRNVSSASREVVACHILLPVPGCDLGELSPAMHTLRQWAQRGVRLDLMVGALAKWNLSDLALLHSDLEQGCLDPGEYMRYDALPMHMTLAELGLAPRVRLAAGKEVLVCIAVVESGGEDTF